MNHDPATFIDYRNYTSPQVGEILKKAHDMGIPLDSGSWVEQMTISQLDRFVNGVYDC